MAKKKAAKKKELAIIKEEVINGAKIITYEDGSVDVVPAPIHFTPEEWAKLQDEDDSDDDEDDSDDDDSDDSDDEDDEDDNDSDSDDDSDDDLYDIPEFLRNRRSL